MAAAAASLAAAVVASVSSRWARNTSEKSMAMAARMINTSTPAGTRIKALPRSSRTASTGDRWAAAIGVDELGMMGDDADAGPVPTNEGDAHQRHGVADDRGYALAADEAAIDLHFGAAAEG